MDATKVIREVRNWLGRLDDQAKRDAGRGTIAEIEALVADEARLVAEAPRLIARLQEAERALRRAEQARHERRAQAVFMEEVERMDAAVQKAAEDMDRAWGPFRWFC